jgi:hypothetical protein
MTSAGAPSSVRGEFIVVADDSYVDELKDALRRAVERDDDILTQFYEKSELRQQIDAAETHADLIGVIRRTRSPRDSA